MVQAKSAESETVLTPWGVPGRLRYRLRIEEQTPSLNEIREMHFHAYRRLRFRFRNRVLEALESKRPEAPLPCALVEVRRYCAGSLDWDNALGGLKPLLDCLVEPTKRNPDGLSLIRDDSPRSMPLPPFMWQLPAPRGKGWTEVFIYELDPSDVPTVEREPELIAA